MLENREDPLRRRIQAYPRRRFHPRAAAAHKREAASAPAQRPSSAAGQPERSSSRPMPYPNSVWQVCFEPMDKPAIARPSASVRIRYFPLQKALHLLSTSLYAFSETTSCTISNFIPPTLSESIKQKPREKPGSISYMGTLSMIVNPISLHSAIAFSISSTLTQMW